MYRALGFHMMHGCLDGQDGVCVERSETASGEPEIQALDFTDDPHPTLSRRSELPSWRAASELFNSIPPAGTLWRSGELHLFCSLGAFRPPGSA